MFLKIAGLLTKQVQKNFSENNKMALKLNKDKECKSIDGKEFPVFREFYGNNLVQMPLLIASSRTPISFARVMQRRLDLRDGPQDVKTAWNDNYFDTADAVIYGPDGEVLVELDAQTLRGVTSESPRNGGAVILGANKDEALANYDTLKKQANVVVFDKGKLGEINTGLSREVVKAHPFWKVIARNQTLLNDFVDYTFEEYQARFAKDTKIEDIRIMGVYPSSCQGDSPEMRALYAYWLENGANVGGRNGLGSGDGRLVGELAPEAQVAKNSGASAIGIYSMADLQTFDNAYKGLESTIKPEVLKPFADLRRKL